MQMSIVNKKSDTIMAKVQLPELLGGGGGGATLFWQYQHFGAPVIPLKINPPLDERALILREALLKKNVFFRALPEKGGGRGRPLPEFFDPFFHHVFPYILTSISCYLILFGHF